MIDNLNKSRVLVNKHTDNPSDINSDVFYSGYGEVAISIKKGEEGIYIKNNENEVVKIAGNSLQYISKSDYDKLVEDGNIDDNIYYMIYENE